MKRSAVLALGASLAVVLAAPTAASANDSVRSNSTNTITSTTKATGLAGNSGTVVRSGAAVHEAPTNTAYGVQVPVGTHLYVYCWRYGQKLENSNVWAFLKANNGVSIEGYMHTNWIRWEGAATYCGD